MTRRKMLKSLLVGVFSLPLLRSTAKGKEIAQRRQALADSQDSDTLIIHFEMFSHGKRYALAAKIEPEGAERSVENFLRTIRTSAQLHFQNLPVNAEGLKQSMGPSEPVPDVSEYVMDEYAAKFVSRGY